MPQTRLTGFDYAAYATTVFAWGTSWIALRMQVGVVAPEVSVLWRFLIAAALMWVWALARGYPLRFPPAMHLRFAGMGLFLFSTNFVLFYYGSLTIPSGLLAVAFSFASVVNMLMAGLVLRQPIERRVMFAGLLGASGVVLMFWPQIAGTGFDRGAFVGLVLCLMGTLSFCTGNLISGAIQRAGVAVTSASAWGMVYGALALFAVSLVRGHAFVIEPTVTYVGALLYLAVISSVLAFAAYLTLLGRIGGARAGYATVMFPVVALAISTVFEGYVWTWPAKIGLVCVLAGNLIVLAPRRKSVDLPVT
jgi:drug/metabolite transporter (DMT)-like permease